jgi:hypothetical protein
MALISSQQRIMVALFLAASLSHGFVISPISRVARPEIWRHVGGTSKSLGGRRYSTKTLRLFGDKETTAEKIREQGLSWLFPVDDGLSSSPEDLSGSRVSMIITKTQDALSPAARALDFATDGWALSYANLAPETESSPVGQAFLASNIAYALTGIFLTLQGDVFLGFLTELVSVASFTYHYTQLQAYDNAQDSNVRLALMIDYILAFSTIFVGLAYILMDQQLPPIDGLVSGGVGIACLLLCWVWERGLPYILLHSLWHLFSAYCGYSIGNAHLGA